MEKQKFYFSERLKEFKFIGCASQSFSFSYDLHSAEEEEEEEERERVRWII